MSAARIRPGCLVGCGRKGHWGTCPNLPKRERDMHWRRSNDPSFIGCLLGCTMRRHHPGCKKDGA